VQKLVSRLSSAGLLRSIRGAGGGFKLARPAAAISIAEIVEAIEGPIAMLPCVSLYFYERCKNCDEKHCGLHDTMVLVRDATLKILDNKTIADLVKK